MTFSFYPVVLLHGANIKIAKIVFCKIIHTTLPLLELQLFVSPPHIVDVTTQINQNIYVKGELCRKCNTFELVVHRGNEFLNLFDI